MKRFAAAALCAVLMLPAGAAAGPGARLTSDKVIACERQSALTFLMATAHRKDLFEFNVEAYIEEGACQWLERQPMDQLAPLEVLWRDHKFAKVRRKKDGAVFYALASNISG